MREPRTTQVNYLPRRPESLVAIVSSRLGKRPESRPDWFRSLRTACVRAREAKAHLVVCPETSAYPFVVRAAELFGVKLATVTIVDSSSPRHHLVVDSPRGDVVIRVHVASAESATPNKNKVALRDEVLFELADQVVALHVRPNGNVERLIRKRLEKLPGSVLLAIGDHLVNERLRSELMALGAVGWLTGFPPAPMNAEPLASSPDGAPAPPTPSSKNARLKISRLENVLLENALIHCTRRCHGPWPDQSPTEFMDHLIHSAAESDHSALATLTRIVQQAQLIGSSDCVPGDISVVSFTAVPLQELHELRVFRPHRGCWDFEPYGLCIDRDWLAEQGAKPVRYASAAELKSLPAEAQLYCQLEHSITRAGNLLDWTVEQEWRVPGNVDLSRCPADKAVVFVGSAADASQLQPDSPWPVVVLEDVTRLNG